jgi:hypothetical protein
LFVFRHPAFINEFWCFFLRHGRILLSRIQFTVIYFIGYVGFSSALANTIISMPGQLASSSTIKPGFEKNVLTNPEAITVENNNNVAIPIVTETHSPHLRPEVSSIMF